MHVQSQQKDNNTISLFTTLVHFIRALFRAFVQVFLLLAMNRDTFPQKRHWLPVCRYLVILVIILVLFWGENHTALLFF